jgi:NAD kinase
MMAKYLKETYPSLNLLTEPEAASDLPGLPVYNPDDRAKLTDHIDLVVAVGGDGTILHASSLFQDHAPPILAFAQGTLGFLVPFRVNDHKEAFAKILAGNFSVALRSRLMCSVCHLEPKANSSATDKHPTSPSSINLASHPVHVMNEIVFQGDAARLTYIDCYVNDKFLTTFAGDGLIVATSTGSTAYSLSCNGSMMHPALASVILTPISPRSLYFRPVIFPSSVTIKLQLSDHYNGQSEAGVWADGKSGGRLTKRSIVQISESPYPVPTIVKQDTIADWVRSVRAMIDFMGETHKKNPPSTTQHL